MRYFLCFVLPPLAVLLCGRPFAALLNLLLTITGVIPGIIHGLLVVSSYQRERQHRELMKVMQVSSAMGAAALQQQQQRPPTA